MIVNNHFETAPSGSLDHPFLVLEIAFFQPAQVLVGQALFSVAPVRLANHRRPEEIPDLPGVGKILPTSNVQQFLRGVIREKDFLAEPEPEAGIAWAYSRLYTFSAVI